MSRTSVLGVSWVFQFSSIGSTGVGKTKIRYFLMSGAWIGMARIARSGQASPFLSPSGPAELGSLTFAGILLRHLLLPEGAY